jgi:hypothetical protein
VFPSSAIVNLRKSETSDLRRSCGLRSQLFIAVSFVAVVGQNAMTSVRAADDQITEIQICDPQRGKRATIFELPTLGFPPNNALSVYIQR